MRRDVKVARKYPSADYASADMAGSEPEPCPWTACPSGAWREKAGPDRNQR